MSVGHRPARSEDFGFCENLYFLGMAKVIRDLKLDMDAQRSNLRASWKAAEVQIIIHDGADIGWMQSSIRDGSLYLEQIFVDPTFQKRGMGTEIISDLIGRATRAKRPVTLGVVKTNPALRLYQRLGFRIAAEDDRKFYMKREPHPPAD